MRQQALVDRSTLSAEFFHGFVQVNRVPDDDCSGQQIQSACPVTLVLIATVAEFTETIEEDHPPQGVAGLSFIQLQAAYALVDAGLTPTQTAKQLGIGRSTLYRELAAQKVSPIP